MMRWRLSDRRGEKVEVWIDGPGEKAHGHGGVKQIIISSMRLLNNVPCL